MIKFLTTFILTTFITLIFPCGSFNCPPFTNKAKITYEIEPTLSLTYNPTQNRTSMQQTSSSSLARNLKQIAIDVINNLASTQSPLLVSAFKPTVTLNQKKFLNVEIIPQTCKSNNASELVAQKGTYFVQNNLVMQRIEDTNCLNGIIQNSKTSTALTTIIYKIDFLIPTGQVLCNSHWIKIADAIKNKIITDTKSNFLNSGMIERI
ncbi:Hypothetical protein SRAE_X000014700 [Strongyloides ratti]|uniref:Uncharacterized protein n=1 Tax=Strongyloides ratti TaxID=34506 RepID=A0A090LRL4_STRRB|nr:Hypothetical protein SRAE_X000014700 [Strongyloides ratti]CEF70817.1 Hypothetical protein SRAE_X000014700 [Strongyloides ratti]